MTGIIITPTGEMMEKASKIIGSLKSGIFGNKVDEPDDDKATVRWHGRSPSYQTSNVSSTRVSPTCEATTSSTTIDTPMTREDYTRLLRQVSEQFALERKDQKTQKKPKGNVKLLKHGEKHKGKKKGHKTTAAKVKNAQLRALSQSTLSVS